MNISPALPGVPHTEYRAAIIAFYSADHLFRRLPYHWPSSAHLASPLPQLPTHLVAEPTAIIINSDEPLHDTQTFGQTLLVCLISRARNSLIAEIHFSFTKDLRIYALSISHKLTPQSIQVHLDIYPTLPFFLPFPSSYSAIITLELILCLSLPPGPAPWDKVPTHANPDS